MENDSKELEKKEQILIKKLDRMNKIITSIGLPECRLIDIQNDLNDLVKEMRYLILRIDLTLV